LGDRTWRIWVAAIVLLGLVPGLIVLALNGRAFLGYPGLAYGPPVGDAYGYYAAAREFISAAGRVPKPVAAVVLLVLVALVGLAVALWRRGHRGWSVAAVAWVAGLAFSVPVARMGSTGAGAVGWPVVWAVPLAPLRALNILGFHSAYYIGDAISLAASAAAVVATACIARRLVGGRVSLIAPALLAAWPFVIRLVSGTGNLAYGAWLNSLGVTLYAEPLSTAAVATALALLVVRTDPVGVACGGALLGFACAVRPSNVTILALALCVVAVSGPVAETGAFVVSAIGPALIGALYWSRGYGSFGTRETKQAPHGLFSVHYLARSWRDSGVFDWKMLIILLPLPLLGAFALRHRGRELVLLAGTVTVTALFYSAYYITALHARFLFVALPALFVLAAAGIAALARLARAGPDKAVRVS
jgi:hypothetical protein